MKTINISGVAKKLNVSRQYLFFILNKETLSEKEKKYLNLIIFCVELELNLIRKKTETKLVKKKIKNLTKEGAI